jgi:hypothetical protein
MGGLLGRIEPERRLRSFRLYGTITPLCQPKDEK